MNVLEDKFYSLKLDIWYKAATFLGMALILIAAENRVLSTNLVDF